MTKRKQKQDFTRTEAFEPGDDLRLNPQKRLVNRFDENSIAEYPVAKPGKMGMRVVDNCPEENIQ